MNINFIELFPLISAFLVFFLGTIVFSQGKKTSVDFTFFLFTLVVTVWLFGTFMMFFNKEDVFLALFWDKFVYIGVVFIPSVLYHFGLVLTKHKDIKRNNILILGYITSAIFLFLIPTDLFIDDVFVYQWGVHTKAQMLHNVFLVYFGVYLTLWFTLVASYYRLQADLEERKKIRLVFIGFFTLAIVGSLGFLPAYGIGIYPFAYVSGIIFTVILAYTILKYKLFDIKIIATEFLVFALIITLLFEIIFSETISQLILRTIVLILVSIFSFLVVRSVIKEVKMRIQMEELVEELAIANSKLRDLDQQKSEFISIASHQLRSPLTAIKGYSSMLIEGSFGKIPEKATTALDRIFQSTQNLVNIVEDLLNISRIEQGRMEYNFETVNFADIAKDVVEELSSVAKKENLDLVFQSDCNKTYNISADKGKIRQIITNLVDNAIKYTKKGKIEVSVSNNDKKNKILLTIVDTGIGISKETLGKIFKKFTRGKGGSKTNTGGSGLGLYVAKEMVKAHKGRIWAQSAGLGKGSIFCVELERKNNVEKVSKT